MERVRKATQQSAEGNAASAQFTALWRGLSTRDPHSAKIAAQLLDKNQKNKAKRAPYAPAIRALIGARSRVVDLALLRAFGVAEDSFYETLATAEHSDEKLFEKMLGGDHSADMQAWDDRWKAIDEACHDKFESWEDLGTILLKADNEPAEFLNEKRNIVVSLGSGFDVRCCQRYVAEHFDNVDHKYRERFPLSIMSLSDLTAELTKRHINIYGMDGNIATKNLMIQRLKVDLEREKRKLSTSEYKSKVKKEGEKSIKFGEFANWLRVDRRSIQQIAPHFCKQFDCFKCAFVSGDVCALSSADKIFNTLRTNLAKRKSTDPACIVWLVEGLMEYLKYSQQSELLRSITHVQSKLESTAENCYGRLVIPLLSPAIEKFMKYFYNTRFWWKCSDLGESIGLLKTLGWVCEEPRPFPWGHLLEATFGLPFPREDYNDDDKEGVPDEDVVSNEVLLHDKMVKLIESDDDGLIKLYIRDVSTLVDRAGSIEAAKPMVLQKEPLESDITVSLSPKRTFNDVRHFIRNSNQIVEGDVCLTFRGKDLDYEQSLECSLIADGSVLHTLLRKTPQKKYQ